MIFTGRVRTVYVKELVDILRDRRTLIAMVVVPVLLYPLLMLGSVQAISVQESSLRGETAVFAAPDEAQKRLLDRFIKHDEAELAAEAQSDAQGAAPGRQRPQPLSAHIIVAPDLQEMVRSRAVQVGVVFHNYREFDMQRGQLKIEPVYDPEEARSDSAHAQLVEMFKRYAARERERRLAAFGIPVEAVEPLLIEPRKVTTPGSVLSQILPLILVLMTITGAIYPAIDLTAGERERGTLETLMVAPVPVIDLIVGKFLVVATIAILGAVLNLVSVSATVYFGGFQSVLAGSPEAAFPFAAFPVILMALVPFAIFFSAVMIAVCSYAHTFKEAQNYITPIILFALVPGGIAALPGSKLAGVMLVVPVANMVLLTKELLLGTTSGRIIGGHVSWTALTWVLASTTVYAAAAVALAARIFGTESVIFADTGSIRSAFTRRLIHPSPRPSPSMALLVVALLFPLWFFVQTSLASGGVEMETVLRGTALWMPAMFLLAPLGIMAYWKVDAVETLRLRPARRRYYLAAVLFALAAWAPLHELFLLQRQLVPVPEAFQEAAEAMAQALRALPAAWALLFVAVIPGACEELFFRGFLLSGLRGVAKKWTALLLSAVVFGLFHFDLVRIPHAALLGIFLGYLCWQSGSVWPAMLAHVGNNAFAVLRVRVPELDGWLGLSPDPFAHLPSKLVAAAMLLLVLAILLCRRREPAIGNPDGIGTFGGEPR